MLCSAFLIVWLLTWVAGPDYSYEAAKARALGADKPLLVMVSASWCVPCKRLRTEVIDAMKRDGALDSVELAIVDLDAQRSLAETLMRGTEVPQIAVYYRGSRLGLKGYQSRDRVAAMIAQASSLKR